MRRFKAAVAAPGATRTMEGGGPVSPVCAATRRRRDKAAAIGELPLEINALTLLSEALNFASQQGHGEPFTDAEMASMQGLQRSRPRVQATGKRTRRRAIHHRERPRPAAARHGGGPNEVADVRGMVHRPGLRRLRLAAAYVPQLPRLRDAFVRSCSGAACSQGLYGPHAARPSRPAAGGARRRMARPRRGGVRPPGPRPFTTPAQVPITCFARRRVLAKTPLMPQASAAAKIEGLRPSEPPRRWPGHQDRHLLAPGRRAAPYPPSALVRKSGFRHQFRQ